MATMQITVAIVIAESFNVEELLEVRMILDEEKICYELFSSEGGDVTGHDGTVILTSALKDIEQMKEHYQGLFLIESHDMQQIASEVTTCIEELYRHGRIVVSIGEALVLVYKAGILAQKKVTGPEHFRTDLSADVCYVSERVVVDETLLSARGPSDAYHITHAACDLLHERYT